MNEDVGRRGGVGISELAAQMRRLAQENDEVEPMVIEQSEEEEETPRRGFILDESLLDVDTL